MRARRAGKVSGLRRDGPKVRPEGGNCAMRRASKVSVIGAGGGGLISGETSPSAMVTTLEMGPHVVRNGVIQTFICRRSGIIIQRLRVAGDGRAETRCKNGPVKVTSH